MFKNKNNIEQEPTKKTSVEKTINDLHGYFDTLLGQEGNLVQAVDRIGHELHESERLVAEFIRGRRRVVLHGIDEDNAPVTVSLFEKWHPYEGFHSHIERWLPAGRLVLKPAVELEKSEDLEVFLSETLRVIDGEPEPQQTERQLGEYALAA